MLSLTFPLGVYALATLALARMTGLVLFGALGAGLVACLAVLWIIVASRTLEGAWRTTLFVAPCLKKRCPFQFVPVIALATCERLR